MITVRGVLSSWETLSMNLALWVAVSAAGRRHAPGERPQRHQPDNERDEKAVEKILPQGRLSQVLDRPLGDGISASLAALGLAGVTVPEPASFEAVAALGLTTVLTRHRRRERHRKGRP
jgi:hypothetical protein